MLASTSGPIDRAIDMCTFMHYGVVGKHIGDSIARRLAMSIPTTRQPAKRFEDLLVWQKAHALALQVYRSTRNFPRSEMYGLTSQMRRAAVSIPSNIVEGFKRLGLSDKLRFLNISQASLEELRYQLILSADLDYLDASATLKALSEVSQLLEAYMQGIRRRIG
ncbi:MAG: four helix bundle protein [Pirellulales bacterium]